MSKQAQRIGNTYFVLAKVLRAQLELGQVKQEIDRRIAEKEEEFENSRLVSLLLVVVQIFFMLGKIMLEQWTRCKRVWNLSNEPRLRR